MVSMSAYRPSPPTRNPIKTSLQVYDGRTVRLKAPDKLRGEWWGPVYAALSRRSKMLRPGDRSPFADADDGMQRPAWEATLLFLRRGQRREDLPPALQEHVDYVAQPRNDTLFECRTSDAPLCGQVVAYHPAARINLVDDIDLLVEPSSGYIYRVAMRHYAGELRQVVAIPLEDVRVNHISQAEYLLGVSHGVPLASAPAHFAATWSALDPGSTSDPTTVLRRVAAAFVVPGTPLVSTVDTSERAVAYITPGGEKAQTTVTAYVVASKVLKGVDLINLAAGNGVDLINLAAGNGVVLIQHLAERTRRRYQARNMPPKGKTSGAKAPAKKTAAKPKSSSAKAKAKAKTPSGVDAPGAEAPQAAASIQEDREPIPRKRHDREIYEIHYRIGRRVTYDEFSQMRNDVDRLAQSLSEMSLGHCGPEQRQYAPQSYAYDFGQAYPPPAYAGYGRPGYAYPGQPLPVPTPAPAYPRALPQSEVQQAPRSEQAPQEPADHDTA
ncbi:hypothetical protein BBJ28_00022513 [Nothophytophthora sp. Chile5]|nr:hypothetical protein BBJ28_00022513 [Nothophytophthora sp. Chile5]